MSAPATLARFLLEADELGRRRYQKPPVRKREGDVARAYWYVRVRKDVRRKDGSIGRTQPRVHLGFCDETTKREAERRRDAIVDPINRMTPGQQIAGEITLSEFLELYYLPQHVERLATTSAGKYRSHIRNHIEPMFGSWPLRKITTRAIQLWFNSGNPKQVKGEPNIVEKSPETRANVLAILSNIFSKARAWECHEAPNPCEHVELGRKYAVRPKVLLSGDQVDMLLEILPPDVRLAAEICDVTGCRISEVLGLQERHIDLVRGTATIEQAWRRGDLSPVTKSDRGVRVVPLLDVADEIAQRMTGSVSTLDGSGHWGQRRHDRGEWRMPRFRGSLPRLRAWRRQVWAFLVGGTGCLARVVEPGRL